MTAWLLLRNNEMKSNSSTTASLRLATRTHVCRVLIGCSLSRCSSQSPHQGKPLRSLREDQSILYPTRVASLDRPTQTPDQQESINCDRCEIVQSQNCRVGFNLVERESSSLLTWRQDRNLPVKGLSPLDRDVPHGLTTKAFGMEHSSTQPPFFSFVMAAPWTDT